MATDDFDSVYGRGPILFARKFDAATSAQAAKLLETTT